METTLKTFLEDSDGLIVHLEIKGEHVGDTVTQFNAALAGYKAAGYKANKGFAQNRGGGGRPPQQETPPPPDLAVPEHCGQPMLYSKTGSGKGVFNCRTGQNCTEPREYNGKKFGKSVWEDDLRKGPAVECPDCGGAMWDNRERKSKGTINERAPDYGCKDRENCGGAIWDAGQHFGPASGEDALPFE